VDVESSNDMRRGEGCEVSDNLRGEPRMGGVAIPIRGKGGVEVEFDVKNAGFVGDRSCLPDDTESSVSCREWAVTSFAVENEEYCDPLDNRRGRADVILVLEGTFLTAFAAKKKESELSLE